MRRGSVLLLANGAQWGGTERHVFDLCRALRQRHVAARVVLGWEGSSAERFREAQLPVDVVPRDGNPLAYLIRLTRYLSERAPGLAHLHGGRLPSLAARRAGVPIVMETRHGLGWPESQRTGSVIRAIRERISGRCLDATVAVCRQDVETLSAGGRRRVYLVPNGIRVGEVLAEGARRPRRPLVGEPGGPAPGGGGIRMGFIGRLTPQKGLSILLRALAEEQRRFVLDVVGSGPLEPKLREEARALGLSDRVGFRGSVEDAVQYIPAWDLMALPSLWEGCPYAVLESLAWGRPVLGTRVGGMEDLVSHGEWGWLADPGDVNSLGRELSQIPWDRETLRQMGEAGREHIEKNYTLDRMVDQILRIYEELGHRLEDRLNDERAQETNS